MLHWGLSSCLFLLHTSDRERKCFSFFLTSVLTLIKPMPDWSCESTSPSVFLNVMRNPSWDSQTPLSLCFLTGRLMLFPEPVQDRVAGAQWSLLRWEALMGSPGTLLAWSQPLPENHVSPASICFTMFQCTPTQEHSSCAGSKAELKLERIISDRLIN